MANWITLVKMAQEWITSQRTMWTFLIGIALLLGLILKIGNHDLAYSLDHYEILWFVMVICAAGLVTQGLFNLGFRFKIHRRLSHLASDEKDILSKFVESNASTVYATFGEPAANSLVDEGILRITSETGRVHQRGGITYYTIAHPTLRYLQKHKDRLFKS
jgi:hypothetical protein